MHRTPCGYPLFTIVIHLTVHTLVHNNGKHYSGRRNGSNRTRPGQGAAREHGPSGPIGPDGVHLESGTLDEAPGRAART